MPRKKVPHFRFYIDDFMNGTMSMSAAEVGDYVRLLCHLYDQGGRVPNRADVLRHPLGCTRQRDAAAKIERLIALGKLFVDEHNYLHNGRTDKEIEKREQWQDANRRNGIMAPLSPVSSPSRGQKKQTKTGTNGTLARATSSGNSSESFLPLFPARKKRHGNGSAAIGPSPAVEGRSGPTPIAGARRPDKPWPPPSQLIPRVYPNGKPALDPLPGAPEKPKKETRQ